MFDLEIGGLFASPEKIGQTYIRVVKSEGAGYLRSGYDVIQNDSIKLLDTMAVKTIITKDIADAVTVSGKFLLAGLVADGGVIPGRDGSLIWDPGTGNRIEYEGCARIYLGYLQIAPKILYRKPLVGPNPIIEGYVSTNGLIYPGIKPRNILDDPFAVTDNREAAIYEVVFTYDPTGANWFYNWDNDEREDATLAFDLVINYASYPTYTDAYTYVKSDGKTYAFTKGLPPADVWTVASRIVSNPFSDWKIIARIETGKGQSRGEDDRLVNFYGLNLTTAYKRLFLKSYVKKDMWGPYEYFRQFNLTYPPGSGWLIYLIVWNTQCLSEQLVE